MMYICKILKLQKLVFFLSIVKVDFLGRKGSIVHSIKMPINQIGERAYSGNENVMQSIVSYVRFS